MTPDALITFAGMDLFWMLLALAGGAFGAMIGANYAFGFTGLTILTGFAIGAATGNTAFLDWVSFGPVFGPHIGFAGGVAGAAYAAKKGYMPSGRDVNTQLVGFGKPDILLVGAVFGLGGYIFKSLVSLIPWFGSHTDAVALTVVTSGIVARLMFGKTGVFHKLTAPEGDKRWLDWQETPGQLLTVSGFASLLASGAAVMLVGYLAPLAADAAFVQNNAQIIPFSISSVCIFFVAMGYKFPVTHHMTIIAGLAAIQFLTITGSGFAAVLIGTCFGVVSGFAGEYAARWTNAHGDTHIDPPAAVIWFMTTAVWGSVLIFS
ncbi:membrane protein [Schaalia vaccimaxillae]|uniref:membrane protein n=1 Tax=Schaalia vaccimaxillae TaxID=183916 RepID=UPI0003B32E7E|nr:membrane protein [Schaalia vaccimaxillae]